MAQNLFSSDPTAPRGHPVVLAEPYQRFTIEAATVMLRMEDGSRRIVPAQALLDSHAQIQFLDHRVAISGD